MKKPLFITGIGTDIGKTIVSAILVEKLQADYWKPVQAGDLENSDTIKVQALVSNTLSVFHPEAYRLTQPFSPHKAADMDGIRIEMNKINLPPTNNTLIIEGAGGLMVPLNDEHLVIDLIQQLQAEVILVSHHYLGSINHTLLSIDALKHRNIPNKAIIINGDTDKYSEQAIASYTKNAVPVYHVPGISVINKENILNAAKQLYSEL